MTATTTVRMAGRDLVVHGDPKDPYFQHAQVHADGLAPLGALVCRHVTGHGTLVDVGANIGLSTMVLAAARPGSRVIAAEPSPVNAALLRRNLSANGFDAVEVVEAALSDQVARLAIHQDGAWTHVWTHLAGPADGVPSERGTPVGAVTLDMLTAGKGPVAFVKVDTEGYEPNVLAGGRTTLERDRPLLLIEFHSWCLTGIAGVSPAAFAAALWDRFAVEHVDAAGNLTPAGRSASDFLYANMTGRGLVEDLVLRLRPGAAVPSLEHMSIRGDFADELHRLRAANHALLRSTSWRITAPLRAAITRLRRGRPAPDARSAAPAPPP